MKSVTPVSIPDELVCFDPALDIDAFNSFMKRPASPVVTESHDREGLDECSEEPDPQ